MLPRLDAILPPAAAEPVGALPAFGDGRQAAFQRALQTLVGQQVSAEVLSKYNDGSFLVRVADNAVRMALPPSVQVGAEVPLTVIAAQPRPTFQLGSGNLPGQTPALVYSDSAGAADLADGLYGPPAHTADGAPAASSAHGAPRTPATATPAAPPAPAASGNDQAADTNPALPRNASSPAAAADLPDLSTPRAPPAASAPSAASAAAVAAPSTSGASAAAGAAGKPGSAANLPAAAPAAAPVTPAASTLTTVIGNLPASAAAMAAGLQAAGVDLSRPQRLAAGLLSKAPLTPSAELPALDASTQAATLSPTARALTSVLSTAPGTAAALLGKTPLFGDGPPNTTQLTQRLHDTITQSGLFYESHVAAWARGELSLQDLLREPQMQRLAQGAEHAARAAGSGPDLSAAQMINQQLQAHEQGRVQWQGQAWPGQPMQWEVRREPPDQHAQGQDDAEPAPQPVWRSGVRFRFALLGEVAATVTLVGEQVHIQMQTGSDASATTLRAYAGQLEQAMAAAGVALAALTIAPDSEAGDD